MKNLPSFNNISTEIKFKPPFCKISNAYGLLKILKKYHKLGKGAILSAKLNKELQAKNLGFQIVSISINKRKESALFYNDPSTDYKLSQEFVQLWRSVNVEHLNEEKIEKYVQEKDL